MKLIYVSCTCHVYKCVPGEREVHRSDMHTHVLQKEFNFIKKMKTECLCVCVDAHACIKKEVGGWLRYDGYPDAYMYLGGRWLWHYHVTVLIRSWWLRHWRWWL